MIYEWIEIKNIRWLVIFISVTWGHFTHYFQPKKVKEKGKHNIIMINLHYFPLKHI